MDTKRASPQAPDKEYVSSSTASSTIEKEWQLFYQESSNEKHICANRALKGEENINKADVTSLGLEFPSFWPSIHIGIIAWALFFM